MKDKVITVALLIITTLNFLDVMVDLSLNVPTSHIIEESMIVLIAGVLAIYLIFDIRKRTRNTRKLITQLHSANDQLHTISKQLQQAKTQYFEAIDVQFNDWKLTPSEAEVALLMIKGLSTAEIAATRNTKEKTVRQQASTVYAKSELEGRYALSAWFFDDILN